MPVGFGRVAMRTMGRPLSVPAHIKKIIVEFKDAGNCLAHALIIAIGKVDNNSNYESYRKGWKIYPVVRNLIETTDVDLANGAGIPELARFQEHFREYKIAVYQGLSCDIVMFEGQVESSKRLNLLYDDVDRHFHAVRNLTGKSVKRPTKFVEEM